MMYAYLESILDGDTVERFSFAGDPDTLHMEWQLRQTVIERFEQI